MLNYFKQLSTKTKVVLAVFAILLIAVALFWSCYDTKPVIEDDNAYKVMQGENNILRQQNDALRQEKDALKSHGEALEKERDGLRAELEKFGKQAAAGVEKQKEAAQQYEKDIAVIGIDIPDMERCQRYCASRSAAGLPCQPNPDAYCRLHYGDSGH